MYRLLNCVIRIVIGLGIAIGGVVFESYWGLIGIVILATGVFRYCLLYTMLKINTNKDES
jgi:predicted MFS family arabinose efflux permease